MATLNQRSSAPSKSSNAELLQRARRSIAGGDSSTMRVLPYQFLLVASWRRFPSVGCRGPRVHRSEYGLWAAHFRPSIRENH